MQSQDLRQTCGIIVRMNTHDASQLPVFDPTGDESGLVIYRASRLEALLAPLRDLLAATAAQDPLQPQTVLAAHPGMKQWLTGALARQMGAQGIVANLQVLLPSSWIGKLALDQLGEHAVSLPRWQRQHLRWSLDQWLGDAAQIQGLDDPRIATFLDPQLPEGERARRRYQLADRLAGLYSRYLVYRPDWLQAWAGGQHRYATAGQGDSQWAATESRLLAPLWQHAVKHLGSHRAQLLAKLEQRLQSQSLAPQPALHVFGLSHLAPAELAILRAYARHGLVALYLPDPCRDYWGVLEAGDAGLWRQQEDSLIAAAEGGDWWRPARHELLARWGRLGQHFFSSFLEGEVREDVRHWQDDETPATANRLTRLQQSIRHLDESLLCPSDDLASEQQDVSLRIHLAHTPQRELEILRDAMLDARARGIEPGQMLVMAPDMQRYLPLLPALFGEPGNPNERLPYHSADVSMSATHPLYGAFLRLLGLPGSRLEVTEVLDILAIPEVARRFGLDDSALERLTEILAQSRVAWSLDARHRASFAVPACAEHGFAWAMDRMIAGYLGSDAGGDAITAWQLPDGTEMLPLAHLDASDAAALGALDALLQQVQKMLSLSDSSLPASEWVQYFQALCEALLCVDTRDGAAEDAWQALRQVIAGLRNEPAVAGLDPVLHFRVAVDWLKAALQAVPERQPFLLGGVTFSGMVPQRAIPFRFIAVLGLNEGEFPRSSEDGGLDLMRRLRRRGDRDLRQDDRYLFLETLMSARSQLHLSYLGEAVKDGTPRNPAAPLAELMAVLEQADGACSAAMKNAAPWRVKHPLQPFDRRYFDGSDVRLFSYQAAFAGLHQKPAEMAQAQMQAENPPEDTLALSAFNAYWRDPAKQLLAGRIRLSLEALEDDRLSGEEPGDDALSWQDSIAQRLLFEEVLADPAWRGDVMPDWLRLDGRLPVGQLGIEAWYQERELILYLAGCLRDQGVLADSVQKQRLPIDLAVTLQEGVMQLVGQVQNVLPHPSGGWQLLTFLRPVQDDKGEWIDPKLRFDKRCRIFIDYLVTRLSLPQSVPLHCTVSWSRRDPWLASLNQADALYRSGELPRERLEARLAWLVEAWLAAPAHPRRYFPRTSWAAWEAMQKDGGDGVLIAKAIANAWDGFGGGERDYSPGYTRLLAGDETFAPGTPAFTELCDFTRALAAQLEYFMEPEA
ncbi:exodeoxyribonuclease V subunit gamma [Lysobacteraceae bacterium NML08-0793]|nr:exodeoxyribonuclease V subunit gamma [Xanthomonadaceae bacterium NML08-0793]